MKEMVGGCCVCSDERGWPENPLVYCDGQHCTVAVHQACYGIVTVPTGPWFCRKCESQERSARVRCELCPSRDGALKRTDNHQSWAHVVCALYIPEVRFGNVTTMEPIILALIPQERFTKVCYICQEAGKNSKANMGACMQCNKSGCKQQFHVTCAQALGLLCEEAGNYLDNVKYCGYCQHHYSKLKKGGNVKTIPPYKPVSHGMESSDPSSSPEKETETVPPTNASVNLVSTYPTSKIIISTSNASNSSNNAIGQSTQQLQSSSSSSSSSSSKQRKSASSSGGGGNSGSSSSQQPTSFSSFKQQSNSQTSTNINQSLSGGSNSNNTSASSSNVENSTGISASDGGSSGNVKDNNKSSSKSTTKGLSSSTKSSTKELREQKHSKSAKNHSSNSSSNSNSKDQSATIINQEYNSVNTSITDSNLLPDSLSAAAKEVLSQKFTNSNFTETVVVNSDSVFGTDGVKTTGKPTSSVPVVKKRKLDSGKTTTTNSNAEENINRDLIKDVSVTLVPLPSFDNNTHELKKHKSAETSTIQSSHITGNTAASNSINKAEESSHHAASSAGVSLVVSVPLSTATIPGINLPTNTSTTAALSTIHQIPTIKSFANTEASANSIQNRSHNFSNINVQPAPAPTDLREEKDPLYLGDKSIVSGAIIRNATQSPLPSSVTAAKLPTDSSHKSKIVVQPSSQSTSFAEISATHNSAMSSSSAANSSAPTITTMESGGIKITYDKQTAANSKTSSQQPDDANMARLTSTPDDNSNSFSDLKITFEAQTNAYETPSIPTRPEIKNSPPSSPSSEIDNTHKRNRSSSNDTKDLKMSFQQKDVHATHMLGNQLNPASSVAQKMSDQLYMELEAHSVYTSSSMDSATPLIGPVFPGKQLSNARNATPSQPQGPSLSSMLGGTGTPTAHGNTPQSLEQLLERQWEQGSQFLMEQAQHFDIASLLSCLHQLRSENIRLEEHVTNLVARRDHLLAVNARLAIPLNQVPPVPNQNSAATFNNLHLNGTAEPNNSRARTQHLK